MEEPKKMTYSQAVGELELILKQLENSAETNLDVISKQVKRASELMEICRTQLHATDEELRKIIEGL